MITMGIDIRVISLSAERLSENIPGKIQYSMQLSLPSGEVRRIKNKINIPFIYTLSSSPPIINVTIRGFVDITGDEKTLSTILDQIRYKKIPQYVFQTAFQYIVFEALYVVRELGIPPPIPMPGRERKDKQFFGEVV